MVKKHERVSLFSNRVHVHRDVIKEITRSEERAYVKENGTDYRNVLSLALIDEPY